MALLSDLVSIIAEVEGLEESFVIGVARYLREAGMISQAGRGRGAARMGRYDAASLIVAVNATVQAKDAPQILAEFGNFVWFDDRYRKDDPAASAENIITSSVFAPGAVLLDCFERLIDFRHQDDSTKNLKEMLKVGHPEFEIEFHRVSRKVKLSFHTMIVDLSKRDPEYINYVHGYFAAEDGEVEPKGDRTDIIRITERTLIAVGEALLI